MLSDLGKRDVPLIGIHQGENERSCASSFEILGLPCRPGSSLPVERQVRYHAPDVEIPIENRRAASRVERPASIASTTRFRKSRP
jgi:hypothetical protein